jgi:trans-2,3-dihydro-3-hydroxyanthranilate isomerase
VLRDFEAPHIFAFTSETQYPGATVHSRMFAPAMGITEDPATGAASGPLGAYLVKYEIASSGRIISEQGVEMGRPSFIHIDTGYSDGVRIGGQCVTMGMGTIYLHG